MSNETGLPAGLDPYQCILCQSKLRDEVRNPEDFPDAFMFNCPKCEPFAMLTQDLALLTQNGGEPTLASDLEQNAWRIGVLLEERRRRTGKGTLLRLASNDCPIVPNFEPIHVNDLLSLWPRRFTDRLDRVLRHIMRIADDVPGRAASICLKDVFAEDHAQASFFLEALKSKDRINYRSEDRGEYYEIRVLPAGIERIEQFESARPMNRPAFAAMWFHPDMTDAFENAIRPAAETFGYTIERVDQTEFNDWIMDQVMSLIRIAPFVIADFTGHRAGVYLEAGYARGLGKPCIHTCREGDLENAHFDVQQVNTIVWQDVEQLRQRLEARIGATIGYAAPH